MTVEEYEEFFGQTFPTVSRPRTAPASVKSSGSKDTRLAPASAPPTKKPKGKDTTVNTTGYRGNAKSAPAGGRTINQA